MWALQTPMGKIYIKIIFTDLVALGFIFQKSLKLVLNLCLKRDLILFIHTYKIINLFSKTNIFICIFSFKSINVLAWNAINKFFRNVWTSNIKTAINFELIQLVLTNNFFSNFWYLEQLTKIDKGRFFVLH